MLYEIEQLNGKFTKFTVKQIPCKHADAKFRQQTINISLYNEEGALIEKIERVKIENKERTEVKAFRGKKIPKAILLNSDDWGYGQFIPNENSIKVFEEKLSNMSNRIDRAVVTNQIATMIKQIEFPANRLATIREQLIDEKNQTLIDSMYVCLYLAGDRYLPEEDQLQFKTDTAHFFLKKAKKEDKDNASLSRFCLEKAFSFISS